MKKLALIGLMAVSSSTFAASGDTSTGSAVFSGFIPGFVSNGAIRVTGAGGSTDSASYTGTLQINSDGTFQTTKPVVLEARAYDELLDEVGDLTPANWSVASVSVLPAAMAEMLPEITVTDNVTATTLTQADYLAAAQLSAGDTVHIEVANTVAHSDQDSIAGSELIVNVDMIAELP